MAWTLTDPTDAATYSFAVGPSTGGELDYQKNPGYENNSAPGGGTLIYDQQHPLFTTQIEGTLLTEGQYNALESWYELEHPVELTDDLARTFSIVIVAFTPKRAHKATAPWFHTYTLEYVVLAVL